VVRLRTSDKKPGDADTIERVEYLYNLQKKVKR